MSKQQIPRLFMVQRLYRRVLKLHRELPTHLKELGDQYAKDEFRRNKGANQLQAFEFMTEWKSYCETLEAQFDSRNEPIGKNLSSTTVDSLSQEQLGQIYELQQETVGKKDDEKPPNDV